MRRRPAPFVSTLTLALTLALTTALLGLAFAAAAADPRPAAVDPFAGERSLLRQLHFDYGLVVACGLADDETETGYQVLASRFERQLGIDDDAEERFREINLGWTEADADWAAKGEPVFRDWCRNRAPAARDHFRQAFQDTGEKLNPWAESRPKRP